MMQSVHVVSYSFMHCFAKTTKRELSQIFNDNWLRACATSCSLQVNWLIESIEMTYGKPALIIGKSAQYVNWLIDSSIDWLSEVFLQNTVTKLAIEWRSIVRTAQRRIGNVQWLSVCRQAIEQEVAHSHKNPLVNSRDTLMQLHHAKMKFSSKVCESSGLRKFSFAKVPLINFW